MNLSNQDIARAQLIPVDRFWYLLTCALGSENTARCELMLLNGASPEWIAQHDQGELPVLIKLKFIEALEYRRRQLLAINN